MSTVLTARTATGAPATSRGVEVRRPRRRPAPTGGPLARPSLPYASPAPTADERLAVRSCRVEAPIRPATWRLTDRGIAAVLVLTTMIVVAAVVVIGLTAWRVTGPDAAAWSGGSFSVR